MNVDVLFKKTYGCGATKHFDCGGRFEILGNHTDHNHGLCLAATASLSITCALKQNNDKIIRMVSEGFEPFVVDLSSLDFDPNENKSASIIKGVAKYLTERGYNVGGFDCVCVSSIFPGAGVSSSAAFELLIGEIFNNLFNNEKIDKLTLAKAGQFSENNYYGKASGLLDQIGVAYGNTSFIDFGKIENPTIENIDFPFDDMCFVGVNTGGDHSSLNGLYSSIPRDMKNAAKKIGVDFLREGSLEKIITSNNLTENEKNRSIHFYNENDRVIQAVEALKNHDKNKFLYLINESRKSSTELLKNMMVENHYSKSPLEACDIAMSFLKENGACKINGGGFAGSIICVLPKTMEYSFIRKMAKIYGNKNVIKIDIKKTGPRCY